MYICSVILIISLFIFIIILQKRVSTFPNLLPSRSLVDKGREPSVSLQVFYFHLLNVILSVIVIDNLLMKLFNNITDHNYLESDNSKQYFESNEKVLTNWLLIESFNFEDLELFIIYTIIMNYTFISGSVKWWSFVTLIKFIN